MSHFPRLRKLLWILAFVTLAALGGLAAFHFSGVNQKPPVPKIKIDTFTSRPDFGFTGTFRDGSTVQIARSEGDWVPTPTKITYTWYADDVLIETETPNQLAYTLTANEVGKTISVVVEASRKGYMDAKPITVKALYPVFPGVTSEAALHDVIANQIASERGTYSVTVTELTGGQRKVNIGGDIEHDPASAIKTFYAYAALYHIEQGKFTLDTVLPSGITVGACIEVMIEISDNNCTYDLRDFMGRNHLNNFFQEMGYTHTYIINDSAGNYVTKRTTTNDIASLLVKLERGTLLNKEHTALLKSHLMQQVWRMRIASGLPQGTLSATKSGQLFINGAMIEADTGIVYAPSGTYIITVIGNNATTEAVKHISTAVYNHLTGTDSTPWEYPLEQFLANGNITYYSAPGSGAIGTIPDGTAVELYFSNRTWYQIIYRGSKVWVKQSDLTLRPEYNLG